jgi:hypothetical protein
VDSKVRGWEGVHIRISLKTTSILIKITKVQINKESNAIYIH